MRRCPESLYPVPAFSEIGVYMRLITSSLARSHCQALSKRIHYGKFVAESKFLSQTEKYTRLIHAHDSEGLMAAITDAVVEAKVRSCMDCRVLGCPVLLVIFHTLQSPGVLGSQSLPPAHRYK